MARRSGIVTASALNVRPHPSTDNEPLGQLPRGTPLEILDRHGSWYEVSAAGRRGFVSADFVRLHEATPQVGFLHEAFALQQIPLEPPPQQRIAPDVPRNAAQRGVARTWNAYGSLLRALSEQTGIRTAAAVAVLVVESSGTAFVDGRMVIRFENHVFHREWGSAHPQAFGNHFRFDSQRRWTGHQFRADPAAPFQAFHGSQAGEWRVFEFARQLHEPAALRSISMGLPQIMGFNAARIGYDSPREMFDRFSADARFQVLGMFDFIRGPSGASSMVQALERGAYEQFASGYNGAGMAAEYGARIRTHVEAFDHLLTEVA